MSADEAVTVLRRHLPDRSDEELGQAVSLWGGVIGQALRGLQDGGYREILDRLPALARGITASSELELLKATAPLEKNKDAIPAILNGLGLILRDALVCLSSPAAWLSTDREAAQALSRQLTRQQLLALLSTVEELQTARLYNMNHTLFLTLLCSRLRQAAGR